MVNFILTRMYSKVRVMENMTYPAVAFVSKLTEDTSKPW